MNPWRAGSEVVNLPVEALALLYLGLAERTEHAGVAAEFGAVLRDVAVDAGGRCILPHNRQLGLPRRDPLFQFLKAAHRLRFSPAAERVKGLRPGQLWLIFGARA
ncbi:hypothetical protein GCM10010429_23080 [Micromonospora olivasterospora]|uniref:Uncharacterized protein n=1 Tax=Micromonospora olivasterospora TaxID=1880 RepID=A0A562HV07_MICOL|nr:hypothetical protein JD77_06349 [Micromonospora olivasterospora]